MVGIIVLCRHNSSRLPGKILKEIDGKPILSYILERLSLLGEQYQVVVCTSDEDSDDPISRYCEQRGVSIFRGDLNNVALRFLNCCRQFGFETAVRINGDNLFVDPLIIQDIVEHMIEGNFDFATNVKGRTFPRGISVEAIRVSVFEQMYPEFDANDMEHVMTFFYRWKEGKKYFLMDAKSEGSGINLAIDTLEDFENAEMILNQMDQFHTTYTFRDIISLYNNLK